MFGIGGGGGGGVSGRFGGSGFSGVSHLSGSSAIASQRTALQLIEGFIDRRPVDGEHDVRARKEHEEARSGRRCEREQLGRQQPHRVRLIERGSPEQRRSKRGHGEKDAGPRSELFEDAFLLVERSDCGFVDDLGKHMHALVGPEGANLAPQDFAKLPPRATRFASEL